MVFFVVFFSLPLYSSVLFRQSGPGRFCFLVSVVVGFEGAGLGESHVLGLIVSQLGEVGVEGREVEAGHELVHQLRHQVDVSLVAAGRGVEQFYKKGIRRGNTKVSIMS